MKNALLIEDNPNNLVLLTRILEYAGYKVSSADKGMVGFKMASILKPDFILLDINLPDINGEEVLEKIRGQEEIKSIPVIAVTSNAMAGDEQRLLSIGFDAYIEKPIEPEKFIGQIKTVIGE